MVSIITEAGAFIFIIGSELAKTMLKFCDPGLEARGRWVFVQGDHLNEQRQ